MSKYGYVDDRWLTYYKITRKYDLDWYILVTPYRRLQFTADQTTQRITHQIRTEYFSCLIA